MDIFFKIIISLGAMIVFSHWLLEITLFFMCYFWMCPNITTLAWFDSNLWYFDHDKFFAFFQSKYFVNKVIE